MSQVDVTVVVPVYNTMPYLKRTLESLVGQSIGSERMHVVAVDDGSSDGSGEELDRYAAAYPALFTVVHQPNSGGPAGPCNVGLEHATGRYVYFLGADDYLGSEALERMVDRADEWDSDVLCGRMVGVDDRYVSQRLYRENVEDEPFPGTLLPFALSNTKLFRRSLLEKHSIRYALDLRVGSDQPFTVEAMHHARRISVLADYDCYHAVKRADAGNITYTATWRARLADIGAVMDHIADLLPAGEERDAVLVRHFDSELAKLLERDYPLLPAEERAEMRAGLRALLVRYYTDSVGRHLHVRTRLQYLHILSDRVEAVDELVGLDEADQRLLLDGEHVLVCLPGLAEGAVPQEAFRAGARARRLIFGVADTARVWWQDDELHLEVPTRLDPASAPYVRVALVPAKSQVSRPPLRRDRRAASSKPWRRVTVDADGTLRWSGSPLVDLGEREEALWDLRLQLDVGEHTFALPLVGSALPPHRLRQGLRRRYRVEVLVDHESRMLVSCVKE